MSEKEQGQQVFEKSKENESHRTEQEYKGNCISLCKQFSLLGLCDLPLKVFSWKEIPERQMKVLILPVREMR